MPIWPTGITVSECDLFLDDPRIAAVKESFQVAVAELFAGSRHLIAHTFVVDWPLDIAQDTEREAVIELYDLESDLGETTNLAGQHPEVVAELESALSVFERTAADD